MISLVLRKKWSLTVNERLEGGGEEKLYRKVRYNQKLDTAFVDSLNFTAIPFYRGDEDDDDYEIMVKKLWRESNEDAMHLFYKHF